MKGDTRVLYIVFIVLSLILFAHLFVGHPKVHPLIEQAPILSNTETQNE